MKIHIASGILILCITLSAGLVIFSTMDFTLNNLYHDYIGLAVMATCGLVALAGILSWRQRNYMKWNTKYMIWFKRFHKVIF
jgi:small basic protein